MIIQLEHLARLRRSAGMTKQEMADLCGLSIRTIRRYEASDRAPRWYRQLLKYCSGQLPGWEGFKIENDRIWTPANQYVTQSEVEHTRWLIQMLCSNSEEERQQVYEQMSYLV